MFISHFIFIAASYSVIDSDNSSMLSIPAYISVDTTFLKIKNLISFTAIAVITLIPFQWLKNIKYNMVAVSGLLMAMNHFNLYDRIVEGIDFLTPVTWSQFFINLIIFLIITFFNMLYKGFRIFTTSFGGGYVAGYITGLMIDTKSKFFMGIIMLSYSFLYIALYFTVKKFRKFMLFGILSGWLIYSSINIITHCKYINFIYSSNKNIQYKGKIILLGCLTTILVIYAFLRIFFYRKNQKKK